MLSERTAIDVVAFLMGAGFTFVGGAMAVWIVRCNYYALRSRRWPRANGIVTSSEVFHDTSDDLDWFEPRVEYSFEASDRKIKSNRLTFGGPVERYQTRPEAEQRVAMFPVGATVRVIHHPTRPGTCALESKTTKGTISIFIGGLLFLVGGISLLKSVILRS